MNDKVMSVITGVILTIVYVSNYEKNYHCEVMTTIGALFFGLFSLYRSWNCNNVVILFLSIFITWHIMHMVKIVKN